MAWIKRNLYFVVSMVAGMALTGYCAYVFFRGDLTNNKAVNKEFQDDVARYNTMRNKVPYPSPENLKLVTNDVSQVRALLDEFRKKFIPLPKPPEEDARGFSTYLEDTILDLKTQATNNSVSLPADMAFGFTDERHKFRFPPDHIPMWMQQLTEIKALCRILYDAKINSVEEFRRVPVSTNDVFVTPTDTFAANIATTPLATFTPYKIEFRCFTPELAVVMEGLARSSNCFIVKNVVVKPAEVKPESMNQPTAPVVAAPVAAAPSPVAAGAGGPPAFRTAAGGGGPGAGGAGGAPGPPLTRFQRVNPSSPAPPPRRAPPPGGATAPATVVGAAPGSIVLPTILREKLLYITLSVDAVKFK